MPAYELSVIMRSALQRPELKDALKRVCGVIYDRGGIIRNVENLGQRELPHLIRTKGEKHDQGNYFIIKFDSSVEKMMELRKLYKKDENVIRSGIVLNEEEPRRQCLDGPCQFGENIPEYDKMAYKKRIYRKLRYPREERVK